MSEPHGSLPSEPGAPAEVPTGPMPATSRRNKCRRRVIGVAAAAVVLAIATIVFLNARYPGTPEAVAEAYIDALRDGDLDRMQELSCAALQPAFNDIENRDEAGANLARMAEESRMRYSVHDVIIDGDRAQVTIDSTAGGSANTTTGTFSMVRESGEWKFCTELGGP